MTSSTPRGKWPPVPPLAGRPPKEDDISAFNSSTGFKLVVFLNAVIMFSMSKVPSKEEKLRELEKQLVFYKQKLDKEMKGYRGVIHESAASEIKHSTVMVYKSMVAGLQKEIEKLQDE
jgi:hypothetical protein